MSERICISDMTLDALTAYIVGLGQPKFRAKQIFKWLHQKLVTEFSQMTDIYFCNPILTEGRYCQLLQSKYTGIIRKVKTRNQKNKRSHHAEIQSCCNNPRHHRGHR